jgi:hypothetical protein
MSKFIYSFGIILFGLFLGYALQLLSTRRFILPHLSPDRLRMQLQYIALLFVNPVAIIGAIWIVRLENLELIALPFIGFFALAAGGGLAIGAAKLLKLDFRKTGALFGCGSFTNIGSIGGLICFIFLGEPGFALVPIYKLFEEMFYYTIGFPVAKYYSQTEVKQEHTHVRFNILIKDPFIRVTVSSIFLGTLLNLSGIHRPSWYGIINTIFVPLGTLMLLCSIGLALKFSKVSYYFKECTAISIIKFIIVPMVTSLIAYSTGFASIDKGLPFKVILILSSMPVAFNALIPPSIYNLDLDLANSCWLFTTSLLLIVLPGLFFIIQNL